MKILILGNSVGLRVRPPQLEKEQNVPFSVHLERDLKAKGIEASVLNRCHGRYLVEQILSEIDLYIREYPDFFILNAGITDACNREIPLWFSNILHGNRSSLLRLLFLYVYKNIIMRFRRGLVYVRGKRPWRPLAITEYGFSTILKDLVKNGSGKILVLGIMEVDKRVESLLPGSNKNIEQLNNYLRSLCEKYEDNVVFVDVSVIGEIKRPDGIHLDAHGHVQLKDLILSKLTDNEN